MGRGFHRIVLAAALLVALGANVGTLNAQGLTGQIAGTITDAGGGVMPGVTVTLTNTGTKASREANTGADGQFTFPDLLAGTYDLKASLSGFKSYEQTGIVLSSTERIGLRAITLEVGGLTETITVQSEAVKVQTTSGERSGLITRQQIEDTGIKGRDFMGVLKTLPGVVDTSGRDAPGWGSVGGMTINGRASFNFSYDGVTNKDTGSNSGNYSAPGLDSIGEIRVQTSNFQAEYGRSSGATITVVTKSGTRDWRGSAAYYKRNERFNANEWARNRQGLPKPIYRYDNTAYTIGGPVLVPGLTFNRNRDKLFFFWSQDLLPRTDPGGLNTRTMPTELERQGNFSQTLDSQGRLIFIRDPLATGTCNVTTGAGGACFPGNIIPANRINAVGQSMLRLMPLPNATDPTGTRQYNYTYQTSLERPRTDQVARVDWNVAQGTTFYSRVQFGYEAYKGGVYTTLGSTGGWPQFPIAYEIPTFGIVNTLLHTFSPTTFSEFTFGVNRSQQKVSALTPAALEQNQRSRVLNNLPQFFPSANPLNIIPNASFGGTNAPPNVAGISIVDRFYFNASNDLYNVSGNVTKVLGKHNVKTGVFVENTLRPATRASFFNGTFSFNGDNQNPFNTNYSFANALTGAVTQYTESIAAPRANGRFTNVEFFVQDNWRLSRRFTIDGGVRFYYIGPTISKGQDVGNFDPSKWTATKAPQLYQPAIVNGVRVARDPLTGQTLNSVFIGRIVPNSGDVTNGMVVTKERIWPGSGVLPAPRIGFAWDVAGDGQTAVRGGFGVFYDRYSDDEVLRGVEQPPLNESRTTNYTTIDALLASPLTQTPQSVRALAGRRTPTVYNWSIGVQRSLPWALVGDIAYVGNAARNQLVSRELNGLAYGSTFLPQFLDATNNNQPLANDLIRPYRGYGSITQREFSGYGDYHAIQVSANRRSSARLTYGVAYTGSVSKNLGGTIDPFIQDNVLRNYTLNGSRPHNLTVNYSYRIPNLSQKWDNLLANAVFDGWQVSGISSILSGPRQGFGIALTGVSNVTGGVSAPGARVDMACDPNLPRGDRTLLRQFNTECIRPPADPNRLGNAKGDEYRAPGYINHDISIFKNVSLKSRRTLQFRAELYNAFNSMQVSGVNTNAIFDTAGNQTNAAFGQVTSAREARRIQLAVRFTF